MKLRTMFKILLCFLIFIPNYSEAIPAATGLGTGEMNTHDGGGTSAYGWCVDCGESVINKETKKCEKVNPVAIIEWGGVYYHKSVDDGAEYGWCEECNRPSVNKEKKMCIGMNGRNLYVIEYNGVYYHRTYKSDNGDVEYGWCEECSWPSIIIGKDICITKSGGSATQIFKIDGKYCHARYFCLTCKKITYKVSCDHKLKKLLRTSYICECSFGNDRTQSRVYKDKDSNTYYCDNTNEKTYMYTTPHYYASKNDPKFYCDWAQRNVLYYWACIDCPENEGKYETTHTIMNVENCNCSKDARPTMLSKSASKKCSRHSEEPLYYYMGNDGNRYLYCAECDKDNMEASKLDEGYKKPELPKENVISTEGVMDNVSTGNALSAKSFFEVGKIDVTFVSQNDKIMSPIKHIQSLIMMFGVLAAVIISLIYGIQWITATSAKRQELKAAMWPLAIGVMLLAIGPKLTISIYNLFGQTAEGNSIDTVKSIAAIAISTIQTVAYVAGAIMILVVAIQWMTATPGKRQELKGKMINIVIGAIIIVGSATLLNLIYNFASSIKLF